MSAERTAAGDRMSDVVAHDRAQLRIDELVEQGMLELEGGRHLAGVECLRIGDCDLLGTAEDLLLPACLSVRQRGIEDLLEDTGHTEDERGTEAAHGVGELRQIRLVGEQRTVADGQDLDEPGEDVRLRQEQQAAHIRVENAGDLVTSGLGGLHEVRMREHAALGLSGGAGSVDDRRHGIGADLGSGCFELLIADGLAGLGEIGESAFVPDPQGRFIPSGGLGRRPHPIGMLALCDEPASDIGVGEHPAELALRRGVVERHGDSTGVPDGIVAERPLVGGGAEDRDPVTDFHAQGDEPLRGRLDLCEEFGRGQFVPTVSVGLGDQRAAGVLSDCAEEDIGGRRGGIDLETDDGC